ncbi:MAG: hypothetical protein U1G07_07080 [Verrucomicrobiota bacterium]
MSGSRNTTPPSSGGGAAPVGPTAPCTSCTVAITPTPLVVCAGCTGGSAEETPTATGSPSGGTFAWASGNAGIADVSGTGGSGRVRGAAPGDTTANVTYTPGGCSCQSNVPVKAIRVELVLRNTGTVTPAPENTTHDADVAASGGADGLGPLPMGQGRGDFPAQAYTSPLEVVATVSPSGAAGITFRWKRLITRRSWNIRHDAAGPRWNVTQRTRRGFPSDDTGDGSFNNAVPNANRRMYIYDDSALLPGNDAADRIGDYIYEEKDFTYRLERDNRGTWVTCAEFRVGQIIKVRRIATSGTVATDWSGQENSTDIRTLSATIDEAKVRGIVGGADPIVIAPTANN